MAAEALFRGTPVVAFNAGALPEVVGPGGVIVPAGDHGAMARAIVALCQDGEKRKELAKRGYEHVMDHYQAENVVHRFYEMVEKVFENNHLLLGK